MSQFHENIRQILTEVDKFLNETLKKDGKLSKKTLEHKQLIIDKLTKFYEENPQLKTVPSQDSMHVKEVDESSLTGGSTKSDESEDANYIDAGNALISAADIKDPVHTGFLEKKQKKGTGLFGGGGKFQKRWCVIHSGIFYYYSNQKDKQQNGSFTLTDYKFRNAPDLSSKKVEKELCFELYNDGEGKRIYQFMARNNADYELWQCILEAGGHPLIEEDIYEEVGAENLGSNRHEQSIPEGKHVADVEINVEEADGEVYEDPDAELPPPPPPPSLSGLHSKPPPSPTIKPKEEEAVTSEPPGEELDEIYDDGMSLETSNKDEALPPVPGRPPALGQTDGSPKPPPVRRNRPHRDLPPPPPKKKKIKLNMTCKPDEDFENRYYGKWDCKGDNSNELTFKKGEIIYVLSREFDDKSWWVGEVNGKFGLVPKAFLTPAYTLIS